MVKGSREEEKTRGKDWRKEEARKIITKRIR